MSNVETIPSVDIIADSAIIRDGKPFFMPDFADNWVAEPVIAVRISRLGKNIGTKFASRYYDAITTALRIKPTESAPYCTSLYTSFDGSVIIGNWHPIDNPQLRIRNADNEYTFSLEDIDINNAISIISRYITLKIGDVIILGRYGDNIDLHIDSTITINLNETENLKVKIK